MTLLCTTVPVHIPKLNNHQLKPVGWNSGRKSGYGSKTRERACARERTRDQRGWYATGKESAVVCATNVDGCQVPAIDSCNACRQGKSPLV